MRPAELWNLTPAELHAIVEANIRFKPVRTVNKGQEPDEKNEEEMTPEEIAERLKMIASSFGRK